MLKTQTNIKRDLSRIALLIADLESLLRIDSLENYTGKLRGVNWGRLVMGPNEGDY